MTHVPCLPAEGGAVTVTERLGYRGWGGDRPDPTALVGPVGEAPWHPPYTVPIQ